MADGFIVRRGGVTTEQALAPTITEVSTTETSITFTITNNDAETATIVHRVSSSTADGDSISLATNATSANITISDLDADTTFTVFATANVTGKVKSNVTQLAISTNEIPAPTITLVSKTTDSITFTLTNNSIAERDVTFGLTTPPTTTTITLAAAATSGNQTFSNLDDDTTFIIFAQAEGGLIGQLSVTTDPEVYALDFDGVDDRVSLGTTSLSIANAYTITVQAKKELNGNLEGLLMADEDVGVRMWQFRFETNGKIRFIRFNSSNSVIASFDTSDRFDDNQFHFISIVFDSSVGSKIYVDGVEKASDSNTTQNRSGSTPELFIGTRTLTDLFFDGQIANAQIWEKALSATEINNFITTPPIGNETGLFALYKFDEGEGTTLGDSAGTNDGTIVGATWVTL